MDKQQSNIDNNIIITAKIIIESSSIVLYIDLIALRGGGVCSTRIRIDWFGRSDDDMDQLMRNSPAAAAISLSSIAGAPAVAADRSTVVVVAAVADATTDPEL